MRFYAPGSPRKKFRPSPSGYSAWPYESGVNRGKYSEIWPHQNHNKVSISCAWTPLPIISSHYQKSLNDINGYHDEMFFVQVKLDDLRKALTSNEDINLRLGDDFIPLTVVPRVTLEVYMKYLEKYVSSPG